MFKISEILKPFRHWALFCQKVKVRYRCNPSEDEDMDFAIIHETLFQIHEGMDQATNENAYVMGRGHRWVVEGSGSFLWRPLQMMIKLPKLKFFLCVLFDTRSPKLRQSMQGCFGKTRLGVMICLMITYWRSCSKNTGLSQFIAAYEGT